MEKRIFVVTVTETWLDFEKGSNVGTAVIGVYSTKKKALQNIQKFIHASKETMIQGCWNLSKETIDYETGYVKLLFSALEDGNNKVAIFECHLHARCLNEVYKNEFFDS